MSSRNIYRVGIVPVIRIVGALKIVVVIGIIVGGTIQKVEIVTVIKICRIVRKVEIVTMSMNSYNRIDREILSKMKKYK